MAAGELAACRRGSDTPCAGDQHRCPLVEVLETGAEVRCEHRHAGPEGERIVEIAAAPLFDESGAIIQVVESMRDITARRAAEEERLQLERRIQQMQRVESLGVLAGGVAHDFNNLLMGVLGNAELILLDLPPTPRWAPRWGQ